MRFLYVTQDFPPPVRNGMMHYVDNLATGLADSGHQVVVLSGSSEDGLAPSKTKKSESITVYRYSCVRGMRARPMAWKRYAKCLENLARKHQVDCLIAHHHYHSEGAWWVRNQLRIPLLFVCHVLAKFDRVLRFGDRSYTPDMDNEQRESFALHHSDATICLCAAMRRLIAEHHEVPKERLLIARTGVSLAPRVTKTPRLRALDKLKKQGNKLVLFVGRDSWEKGSDLLPEIITGIHSRTEKAHFILVGISRRRWAEYLLLPHTQMLDWMGEQELFALYQVCDVLILPSRRDPLPYVLLESMAQGLVPVVTDVDGPAEVVKRGKCGFRVPTERKEGLVRIDTGSMVDSVVSLVEDAKLRNSLSLRAREEIRKRHTLDHQVKQFVRIAEKLRIAMPG